MDADNPWAPPTDSLSPPPRPALGKICPNCGNDIGWFAFLRLWRRKPQLVCPHCHERLASTMPGLLEWLPGIKYGFIGTVVFAIDRDWQLMLGLLAMQLLAAVIGSTLIAIVLRHRGELLVMDQQHTLGPPTWF